MKKRVMKKENKNFLKDKDNLKLIGKLIIFLIILTLIAFLTSFIMYFNTKSYQDVQKRAGILFPVAITITLLSLVVYFYAGYAAVKKYNKKLKTGFFIGLIIGLFQSILSMLNLVLMYLLIPGYQATLKGLLSSISNSFVLIILIVIILILFTMIMSGLISLFGGYIAKLRKK